MAEQPQPLHLYSVGRPYDSRRTTWPEGADFNYRGGEHELRIFLEGATPREIEAVRSGPVDFGFFSEPEGLFLITRFGPSLSFDCSYSWHRVDPAERTLPPPSEETRPELRALCHIILVEATTGVILALRAVSFSPEFTRALHRAIADQAAGSFDPAAHRQWADRMTRRFPTGQLWARCTTRCQGGD
jgi:hypothetical protein